MSEENKKSEDVKLMPHEYDGIQEYDQKLPNWWLWTLYLAMIFSFGYWFYFHRTSARETSFERVDREMAAMTLKASENAGTVSDEQLWVMSADQTIVSAGKETFMSTCASCHGQDLKGGIGQNLIDDEWIHGSDPLSVHRVVDQGVLEKGMPSWGPVLGKTRVNQVVAFILSHHDAPE